MERWSWDESSMQGLDAYNTWKKVDWRAEERIWTVAALLSDLGVTPLYGHHAFQHEQKLLAQDPEGEESSRAAWTFPKETPLPFFPSFDLNHLHLHLPLGQESTTTQRKIWTPPPPPPETEAAITWLLTPQYRSWPPKYIAVFKNASGVSRQRQPTSYSLVNMKPWRRLGVIIWDIWRVYSLGLYDYDISRTEPIPTPDGGILEALPREQIPRIDSVSRWLALIGEERPRRVFLDHRQ
ncbi:hypothetical protein BDW59DRAFT_167960 [Aspergillus cavernicola]|uniref:Uncharacterized protein n=1 Tax=Aspergillus cavernicola TaxID=176166 RepID=A0ABR4H8F9_9EURO